MAITRIRRVLDDAGADSVIEAAVAHANERALRVVVAVVDPAGELIQLRRTQGAQIASSRVAVDKARTAAIFVRASRELEEQVSAGRIGALALHGASALIGGIPLVVEGQVVGAIGTSGETPDEDEQVSIAGAAALTGSIERLELTYDGARLAAEAAGAAARQRGVAPVVAVVDTGGELVYLWRPDRAQVASVGVATDKARTAAIYRRPSKDFEEQASGGRPSALHLARAVPLQGGIPVEIDGQVVGAVGVSGASSAPEDSELALIGARAAVAASTASNGAAATTFLSRRELDERFAEGGLIVDSGRFSLDAGRRVAPGDAEYHEGVVDVMHVVRGTATVVTGGTLVDPRETGPGELRARSIEGGEAQRLEPGDVLAIPCGVPHQFVDVTDPFHYFVVKVEA